MKMQANWSMFKRCREEKHDDCVAAEIFKGNSMSVGLCSCQCHRIPLDQINKDVAEIMRQKRILK